MSLNLKKKNACSLVSLTSFPFYSSFPSMISYSSRVCVAPHDTCSFSLSFPGLPALPALEPFRALSTALFFVVYSFFSFQLILLNSKASVMLFVLQACDFPRPLLTYPLTSRVIYSMHSTSPPGCITDFTSAPMWTGHPPSTPITLVFLTSGNVIPVITLQC